MLAKLKSLTGHFAPFLSKAWSKVQRSGKKEIVVSALK